MGTAMPLFMSGASSGGKVDNGGECVTRRLGDRVRELRKAKNLGQRAFGQTIGSLAPT